MTKKWIRLLAIGVVVGVHALCLLAWINWVGRGVPIYLWLLMAMGTAILLLGLLVDGWGWLRRRRFSRVERIL